jgi:hypothetical protein
MMQQSKFCCESEDRWCVFVCVLCVPSNSPFFVSKQQQQQQHTVTSIAPFLFGLVWYGTVQKYLGEIPQVEATHNVVGNGNEYGLVIGESTFGGVEALAKQPGAIIDYGSLIYLTLQRAKTARGAIQTMADLMGEYNSAHTHIITTSHGAKECNVMLFNVM